MDYRHELKFIVTDAQLKTIEFRLKPLMHIDTHQEGSDYSIRSLYFDDYFNSCLEENLAGLNNRFKYRLRIYNADTSFIRLEKKCKTNSMTQKESATISLEECRLYMAGDASLSSVGGFYNDKDKMLKNEFYIAIKAKGFRPVCIVEYKRTAYTENKGNVRITFDRNISATSNVSRFLEKEIMLTPLLLKGQHVLEVKYDEFLPEYLADILEIGSLQQSAFSKYVYARNAFAV